ncbi:MAG: DUF1330 domain-containing protein [Alphaproteobacteria bacterium]|jgi:uncharacterized protein (DUF1330 family)|nr:DUF1330 domain-containing protein [Alphaproteobacteria bacterium]
MTSRQPTADQFRAFRDDPHDGPVAQVNLLKFRPHAEYPETAREHGDGSTGYEAYARYADLFEEMMKDVGGQCIFRGDGERSFIGEGDWDMVWINWFPNRQAFIATLNHDNYQEAHRHREAGLDHQELIVTRPLTPG